MKRLVCGFWLFSVIDRILTVGLKKQRAEIIRDRGICHHARGRGANCMRIIKSSAEFSTQSVIDIDFDNDFFPWILTIYFPAGTGLPSDATAFQAISLLELNLIISSPLIE